MDTSLQRRGFWLAATVLLISALWARVADQGSVFTPQGVELKPTDSHYYTRFAQRQLDAFPRFEAFDPWVNFPTGARIIWPPVHTWLVSASIALFGGGDPERGAAWAGPVLSMIWLAIALALIARGLGRPVALGWLFLFGLVPVAVYSGSVGNADHHVHEPFIALAVSLLEIGRAHV